jgi:hypothetical protein
VAGPSKRVLFDAERKERFLGYFCGEANLSWAARKVGVSYKTVLRHRATDPAFGEAYDLAEAQAVPRLRAWLVEAKAGEAERLKEAALGEGADPDEEEEPGGETAPARLSVEQAMQFLRDHEASQARRERALRSGPGRGNGRPVSVASNEEVKAALVKALRAHGIRVRSFDTASRLGSTPTQDERGRDPERPAPVTPPPPFGPSVAAQPAPPSGSPPDCGAAAPPSPSSDREDEE